MQFHGRNGFGGLHEFLAQALFLRVEFCDGFFKLAKLSFHRSIVIEDVLALIASLAIRRGKGQMSPIL